MNPRQLPVIYVRPDMMMQRQYFTLRAVRETDVAYSPKPPVCITCDKFIRPVGEYVCNSIHGLGTVKQDGTSFCSYHVERTL